IYMQIRVLTVSIAVVVGFVYGISQCGKNHSECRLEFNRAALIGKYGQHVYSKPPEMNSLGWGLFDLYKTRSHFDIELKNQDGLWSRHNSFQWEFVDGTQISGRLGQYYTVRQLTLTGGKEPVKVVMAVISMTCNSSEVFESVINQMMTAEGNLI